MPQTTGLPETHLLQITNMILVPCEPVFSITPGLQKNSFFLGKKHFYLFKTMMFGF